MEWTYTKNYGVLPQADRMKVEALVKIAEQLEQLNKNLSNMKSLMDNVNVKVSGGINTHPF